MVLIPWLSYSQPYGNEWINYNQKYFRFSVFNDGVIRLDYDLLENSLQPFGFQISNIDPELFQVWGRGQQQYLYIHLGSDGIFNQGDFIEFYAQKNDGWFDSAVYNNPASRVNPYYSLFTDSAGYYFSWNTTGNNPRMIYDGNVNFSSYTPLNYIWYKKLAVYTDEYLAGERYATSDENTTIGDAAYTGGEGWSGYKIQMNQAFARTLTLDGLYSQGPDALAEFSVTGGSNRALTTDHCHLEVDIESLILVDTFCSYFVPVRISRPVALNQFFGGNASFVFKNIEVPGQIAQEWASVAYLSVLYPRTLNFNNITSARFNVPESAGSLYSYVRMSGITLNMGDSLHLYDLTNHRLIRVIQEGLYQKALVANMPGEESCFFIPESQVTSITSLSAVEALTAQFTDFGNPSVNHAADYLIITHSSLLPEAQQYATYRETEGYPQLFKTLVCDVDQLYDQFAFGIRKDPQAIKNYVRFALDQFPNPPQYLFLIGKSYISSDYRKDAGKWNGTLVPTFGYPPSDWLFSMELPDYNEVRLPTGRLSAYSEQDVIHYLEKVKEFEENLRVPKESFKNILQFGGGSNSFEQDIFHYFLTTYDTLLRGPLFGGNVTNIFKDSPDPILVDQSLFIRDMLENKGVSMITYFGHASGISYDMSIGDPGDYNNEGKYYFVIGNSCWAGDIFDYHYGLSSERYVLLPKKGAIAYLASVSEGEFLYLHVMTHQFFENFTGPTYGQSLGKIIGRSIHDILSDTAYKSFSYRETCQEMALHGDPALVMNSAPFPDYDLTPSEQTPSKIEFIPSEVTTESDSFRIRIIPTNNGKALDTMFFVRIQRLVAGKTLTDTLLRVKAPLWKDTICFTFGINRVDGIGINTFRVTLDALNEIDENNRKFNNSLETNLFIQSADLLPISPPEYGIVPSENLILRLSTSYPFSSIKKYIIELDTNPAFQSALKRDTVMEHAGGVISWSMHLPVDQDSVVYFWRCGLYKESPGEIQWKNSSFQYIQGKRGWSQAHFLQMDRNEYRFVRYLKDSLKFAYIQDFKTVEAQTYNWGHTWQEENFKVNNDILDIWSCTQTDCYGSMGLKFAVFNPVSFEPWISHNMGNGLGPYGNVHCRAYPLAAFDFCTYDSAARQVITDFISIIPGQYYVLAFSHGNHRAQEYEEHVFEAFESIGSQIIRQIRDTSPYIIFGRKGGAIGSAFETGLDAPRDSLVKLEVSVETNYDKGSVLSVPIGPASQWHSVHWRVIADEDDSVKFGVLGIRPSGQADTILCGVSADSADIYQLEQLISASAYPYLRLLLIMKDTSTNPSHPRNPPFLKRWQVLFDPVPETAIDPSAGFSFHRDTVQEGDPVRLKLAFHNISEADMDSLLVVYWLKKGEISDTLLKKRLRPHPAGDILTDSVTFSTIGRSGYNRLWVEVNPYFDQPEQTHVNNIGEMGFYVDIDKISPWMDVTFDRVHIRDYDYVSPTPEIKIVLRDENLFMRLTDTNAVRVWLNREEDTLTRVYYSHSGTTVMNFQGAGPGSNECIVTCHPVFSHEGSYLLTVGGQDASNNLSGSTNYRIHFRVKLENLRTEVFAMPNPFSSYTRFAFILTGTDLPESFSISIYDLSGRPVREITAQEFGSVHIGTNISRTFWDGRDQHGKLLPNGLYLYSVNLRFKGDPPLIDPSLDSRDYKVPGSAHGKIIIMR
ncbi:MAG: C25 family cysteine peptidase [Bacteroidetes bacterium]|nr:C25 family cysteine peptidase [Bacteroidota bacterium]